MLEKDIITCSQGHYGVVVIHCLMISRNAQKSQDQAFRSFPNSSLEFPRETLSPTNTKRSSFLSVVPQITNELICHDYPSLRATQLNRPPKRVRLLPAAKTVLNTQRDRFRRSHMVQFTINALLELIIVVALLQLARDKTERRGP